MKKKITLSLVIPVYNEEQRLHKTIQALSQKFSFPYLKLCEVIFVDDGSSDKTKFQLETVKSNLEKKLGCDIQIISYPINNGKGFAVKTGALVAKGDYALILDADISTRLSELTKCAPFIAKGIPIIIGTRKNKLATIHIPQPLYRQWLGHGFTLISQVLLNTWVSDFTCGFKLFQRQARKTIFTDSQIPRWGFDAEVLFLARIYQYQVQEVAVEWNDEKGSRVHIISDMLNSFKEIMQIRLNYFYGKYQISPSWMSRVSLNKALP